VPQQALHHGQRCRELTEQHVDELLELYLDKALPKDEYTANRKPLETDIAAAENERRKIQTRLNIETLTPERIANINEFARQIG